MKMRKWMLAIAVTAFLVTAAGVAAELVPGWTLVKNTNWQKTSGEAPEPTEVTDAQEGTRGSCPAGMVQVQGMMLDSPEVEKIQDAACTRWDEKHRRCFEFDAEAYRLMLTAADIQPRSMKFCVDRFEFPNVKNVNPLIDVTYYEASAYCKAQGKRLCDEREWTFACEGEDALPYPYGYTRLSANDDIAQGCNTDVATGASELPNPRNGAARGKVLAKLWHGRPSGSMPGCRSPFGVYDLTGNIDEITERVTPAKFRSIYKGGYWSNIRARCRPSTRAHGEGFSFYQQGFRCCANLK